MVTFEVTILTCFYVGKLGLETLRVRFRDGDGNGDGVRARVRDSGLGLELDLGVGYFLNVFAQVCLN